MSRRYNNNLNHNQNFNNQSQNQQYKKSGMTLHKFTEKHGYPIISAWRKTKNGIMSIYARPYVKSKWWKGEKSGKTSCNLMVTVRVANEKTFNTTGFYQKESGKLTLPDLGLVASPNGYGRTRNGKTVKGFFGRIK
jgi:hypothetical protein